MLTIILLSAIFLLSTFVLYSLIYKSMKTNFLNYLLLAVFIIGAAYCLYRNRESEKDRSLQLENIEALAAGEGGGGVVCYGSGSVTCPGSGDKVEGYIRY